MTARETSRSPGLAELIRLAMKQNQAELHVSLPGRIDAYNAAEQKADIKPLLKRPLVASDGTILPSEELPILMDVPIVFPRGGAGTGDFFLSWPLAAGDLVHLIFNERSIDQYLDKRGEDTDPIDFRMHNLGDAVAYPGFYPRKLSLAEADPDNAVFGRDEGIQLHVTPGDTAEFRVAGLADVSVAIAEALQTFWDSTVKPKFDAFDAHIHTAPAGGGPTTVPSVTVAFPTFDTSVISDKVKLKDNG